MRKFLFAILILSCSVAVFCQQLTQSEKAQKLQAAGLVSITSIDTNIVVELKYSTTDNFTGQNLYGDFQEAYLQPEVAKMLGVAQKQLKDIHSKWNLIVYDAARPRSVQQKMWDVVKNTNWKNYVASPASISMHSYGVAVDLSIVDEYGKPIDMGTPFDDFSEKSEPRHENKFLQEKQLTQEQINNRLLLRNIMKNAGFRPINNEWWHFDAMTREQAKAKYTPID